jgi:transposase
MGRKVLVNEAKVIARINAGDKQREIAEDLGVSRQWVALFARQRGLNRPTSGRPPRYDHKRIVELLDGGSSYAEVMDIVGAPSEMAVRAAAAYWKRKMN